MQIEKLSDSKIPIKGTESGVESCSEIDASINAMVTMRIVQFYKHLVANGSIKSLPGEGPAAI